MAGSGVSSQARVTVGPPLRTTAARLEPAQMEDPMAKAQDAKKETKKKPEKTLKEKRLEKATKKASK